MQGVRLGKATAPGGEEELAAMDGLLGQISGLFAKWHSFLLRQMQARAQHMPSKMQLPTGWLPRTALACISCRVQVTVVKPASALVRGGPTAVTASHNLPYTVPRRFCVLHVCMCYTTAARIRRMCATHRRIATRQTPSTLSSHWVTSRASTAISSTLSRRRR
jgi:hypothetical protein